MASLMDQALFGEPMCDEFIQYLHRQVNNREFMAAFRKMERRLDNGHHGAAAVKPSKRSKHRWR